jgi:hypothetical protein
MANIYPGDAFEGTFEGRLFPVVGIGPEDIKISTNFGQDPQKPFMYDLQKYGKEKPTGEGFKKMEGFE